MFYLTTNKLHKAHNDDKPKIDMHISRIVNACSSAHPLVHLKRSTCAPEHSCRYLISQSCGNSTIHKIMQIKVKRFG